MFKLIEMPYDLYDYFLKQKNKPIFREISNIVRQNIWHESADFVISQEWIKTEDRIFYELYYYLRYN